MIADKLQQTWGQPVVVDNKPGASGIIGTQQVVRTAADGYTLLYHNTVLIQQPSMMEKLPYDPLKDLQPVTATLKTNNIFVVPASSPAKTLKEFIDLARSQTAQGSYGSYGIGSAAHLNGELFKQQTGLDLTHVAFQGSAPMITNLIGNQLPSAFIDIPSALPHMKNLRPLAIAGTQRPPELSGVPTFTELGYKSFEPMGWHGLFLPAGTPSTIAQKISKDVNAVLQMPDVQARLKAMGVAPGGGTPEEFAQVIKADAAIYADITKAANIRITQ
jgi:tripartite-type tricarboxylate transporter receptor subunit TctC